LTIRRSIRTALFPAMAIAIAGAVTVGARHLRNHSPAAHPPVMQTNTTALNVQVQASQFLAAPGDTDSARFLVLVTDHETGVGVNDLTQSNFRVLAPYLPPGAACGFSNNITFFDDAGAGAYLIQVEPRLCPWVQGDYLTRFIVRADPLRQGQGLATLSIR
jgi:hypothetical protein